MLDDLGAVGEQAREAARDAGGRIRRERLREELDLLAEVLDKASERGWLTPEEAQHVGRERVVAILTEVARPPLRHRMRRTLVSVLVRLRRRGRTLSQAAEGAPALTP